MEENFLPVVPIIDTEGPSKGRADMFSDWGSLGEDIATLDQIDRNKILDSFNNPMVISWFLLDWSGFSENDPEFKRRGHDSRRRHAIWNFYTRTILSLERRKITGDGVYWHFHHPPKDGSWGWNKNWNDSDWHEHILGTLILEYSYFPSVYRAGKYVETNQSSYWLEKWIPFDYSNVSPVRQEFCDWREASTSWVPYHPAVEDYQKKGFMKRVIARSIPVAAKGGSGSLKKEDVVAAFEEVKEGKKAIFSFHSHDYYKSLREEFKKSVTIIEEVSRHYGIPWKYMSAKKALCHSLSLVPTSLKLSVKRENLTFVVKASEPLFGETPFIVIEGTDKTLQRISATARESSWEFHVPKGSSRVGVGAVDMTGATSVFVRGLL